MRSLSSREVHLLGDVIDFARRSSEYARQLAAEATMAEHALRYALQCVYEACIQIEGKRESGRFAELFPGEDIRQIRRVANEGRHDYGRQQIDELVADVDQRVPALSARAEELLSAHRRLHGADPGRLQD